MPSKLHTSQAEVERSASFVCLQVFIEGFTNSYCIEYECAAGECAANLQSVSQEAQDFGRSLILREGGSGKD